MASVLRNLLFIMALVGLFGQTTARARPIQAIADEPAASASSSAADHCTGMGEATAASHEAPAEKPCKTMTGECIGKMGCAVAVKEPPLPLAEAAPVRYEAVAYQSWSETRSGRSILPELFPPITLG